MLVKELIDSVVAEDYRDKAHVRGIIGDKDSWWHVHWDEELPTDYPVVVYIRT